MLPQWRLTVYVLLLVVMGGRVIPFFIERGLPGVQNRKWPWIERLSIASVFLFIVSDVFLPASTASVVITLFAALVQMVRVAGWYHHRIWSVSLLWVLFLGYAWVAVGLLLHAVSALGLMSAFLALAVRVGTPLVWPQHSGWWVTLSGALWLAAFVSFVAIYFPIVTRPRVGGQPG